MNFKQKFINFLGIAILGFVVGAGVTYLYSLIFHGTGSVDWGAALRLGIMLGIILSYTSIQRPNK
jgi:hypothetical protein